MPAEQDVGFDVHSMAVNHRRNDWALGTLARAYLALEAELLAAQEREKALRDDLEWIGIVAESWHGDDDAKGRALKVISQRADEALAGSPSEKPDAD